MHDEPRDHCRAPSIIIRVAISGLGSCRSRRSIEAFHWWECNDIVSTIGIEYRQQVQLPLLGEQELPIPVLCELRHMHTILG